MSNYSSGLVNIAAVANYPTDPQVVVPFAPNGLRITSEGDALSQAIVSFDGTNDHAVLTAGTGGVNVLQVEGSGANRIKIWLKKGSGANNKAQVVAWK